jgi:hypothetical protein
VLGGELGTHAAGSSRAEGAGLDVGQAVLLYTGLRLAELVALDVATSECPRARDS